MSIIVGNDLVVDVQVENKGIAGTQDVELEVEDVGVVDTKSVNLGHAATTSISLTWSVPSSQNTRQYRYWIRSDDTTDTQVVNIEPVPKTVDTADQIYTQPDSVIYDVEYDAETNDIFVSHNFDGMHQIDVETGSTINRGVTARDTELYNGDLYVVDNTNNQISKYPNKDLSSSIETVISGDYVNIDIHNGNIYSSKGNGVIEEIDASTGNINRSWDTSFQYAFIYVDVGPNGKYVVGAGTLSDLTLIDLDNNVISDEVAIEESEVEFDGSGYLYTVGSGNNVNKYDISSGTLNKIEDLDLGTSTGSSKSLEYDETTDEIYASDNEGFIVRMDTNGNIIQEYTYHPTGDDAQALDYIPSTGNLFSGGYDGTSSYNVYRYNIP